MKLPTIEVRYENLSVEAECKIVHGKPLPTLWNSIKDTILVRKHLQFLGLPQHFHFSIVLNQLKSILSEVFFFVFS